MVSSSFGSEVSDFYVYSVDNLDLVDLAEFKPAVADFKLCFFKFNLLVIWDLTWSYNMGL